MAPITPMIGRACDVFVGQARAPLRARSGNATQSPAELKADSDETKKHCMPSTMHGFSASIGMELRSLMKIIG
jgi:hypothetical protein